MPLQDEAKKKAEKLKKFVKGRRKYVTSYNEAFRDLTGVIIPKQNPDTNSSWHLYILQLILEELNADRKQIFKALRAENIGVNVHYIPVYYHPYYQKRGYQKGICPNAEYLYERFITLPLFPKMTVEDCNNTIEAVIKVINYYR